MEKRVWKVVWLSGGIILTLILALATGLMTLPPSRSTGQDESAELPLISPQPAEDNTKTILQYPSIPKDTVATATQDWVLYVNETYGFQIRYPAYFYTTTWNVNGVRELYISFIDRTWKNQSEAPEIGIVVYRNSEQLPPQAWLRDYTGDPANPGTTKEVLFVNPTEIQEVKTSGADALKFINGGMISMPSVLINREKHLVKVYYTPIGPDNLEPIYELMLATLEFKTIE